jgi:hypothetical protein
VSWHHHLALQMQQLDANQCKHYDGKANGDSSRASHGRFGVARRATWLVAHNSTRTKKEQEKTPENGLQRLKTVYNA